MGLVHIGPNGELMLTLAGRNRNRALHERARAIEARELSNIPQNEIASCRHVLSKIVERKQTA